MRWQSSHLTVNKNILNTRTYFRTNLHNSPPFICWSSYWPSFVQVTCPGSTISSTSSAHPTTTGVRGGGRRGSSTSSTTWARRSTTPAGSARGTPGWWRCVTVHMTRHSSQSPSGKMLNWLEREWPANVVLGWIMWTKISRTRYWSFRWLVIFYKAWRQSCCLL